MYSESPLTLKRVHHEDPGENTTFDTTSYSRVIAFCILINLIILQHVMVNLGEHQYFESYFTLDVTSTIDI